MNRLKSAQLLLTLMLISLTCLTALVIATGYVLTKQNVATKRLNRAIMENAGFTDKESELLAEVKRRSDRRVELAAAQEESRSLFLALVYLFSGLLIASPLFVLGGYGYHRKSYAELGKSEEQGAFSQFGGAVPVSD